MAQNNLSALIQLAVDKAQARIEINKSLKEIQKDIEIETGIKVNLSDIKKAQKELNNTTKDTAKSITELSRLTKAESIQKWADNNSKAMKKHGTRINEIIAKYRDLDKTMDSIESTKLNTEFKHIQDSARKTGDLGKTAIDKIKDAVEKFGGWSLVTGAMTKVWMGMQKVYDEAVNLDSAMTDLAMATNLTKTQMESLADTYSDLAEDLNSTVTDVIESGTEWIKQGQSIADTETLISNAMILSKIGKLSSADATKYLTSAMKGYQVTAENTLNVVDKLSAVDMASATDVGGLAEGMSGVAASADLAGVSMDKLLGYLAAVGEVTQDGMSQTGTTFNAIFSRMGNIKLSRLTDYETGEDLSNVETVLKGVGINLRDAQNSFREFDEVLDETASRWTSFSDVQQRAIASAFSGTHHMNEFIILMENYDNALKYTEASMNSSGEAMQKFSEYQDSVAAHSALFEKSVQDLANTAIDSGLVNWFIDLGTTGVKALDWIIDKIGVLTPLISGVGIGAFVKNFAWLVKGDNNFKLSYSF